MQITFENYLITKMEKYFTVGNIGGGTNTWEKKEKICMHDQNSYFFLISNGYFNLSLVFTPFEMFYKQVHQLKWVNTKWEQVAADRQKLQNIPNF